MAQTQDDEGHAETYIAGVGGGQVLLIAPAAQDPEQPHEQQQTRVHAYTKTALTEWGGPGS